MSNKVTLRSLGGIGNIAKYTSPLKLFDYLAIGKLVIISDLKVFNEIVQNNKHCIMRPQSLEMAESYSKYKNNLRLIC